MFTIRFNAHESGSYLSVSCRSYYVVRYDNGSARVEMEFADGKGHQAECVGPSDWAVAYVTNAESRTVDVVREVVPKEISAGGSA